MSDDKTKQRFSARVKTETLDDIEAYQEANGLSNRSVAIEHMVEDFEQRQQRASWWDTLAEQAMFAATISLLAVVLSAVSFVVSMVLVGYPSPWTVVTFALLVGGVLTAVGGAAGHKYARSKAEEAVR